LIQRGSHEILLADATRLAVTTAVVDVGVQLEVTPDVSHVFRADAGLLGEGATALPHTTGPTAASVSFRVARVAVSTPATGMPSEA
jgi:hypothetical protein